MILVFPEDYLEDDQVSVTWLPLALMDFSHIPGTSLTEKGNTITKTDRDDCVMGSCPAEL